MRNYIVASWNDADQYDYSGEMLGGSRHQGRSQKVHFNPDGSACVASYGDPEVKSKVSIADKILPQAKRLTTLREQMVELEQSYRNGEMSISEYSLLRDVIVSKIERQEVLLKRAVSVRPIRDETGEVSVESVYETDDLDHTDTPIAAKQSNPSWVVDFIDELPQSNFFKSFLKMSCKVVKTAVEYKHKAATYLNTLKEV